MQTQQLLEQYILSRSLYWRHELSLLDEEVVSNITRVLDATKLNISDIFEAEAQELASITDWSRERMQQLDLVLDEVLA